MSMSGAHVAIMERVSQMPGAPNIVWPDDDGTLPSDPPRFVMQAAGGARSVLGLSRATEGGPEVNVRVETASGKFAKVSNSLVAALEAHFAVGTEFDGLKIMEPPDVRPARSEDGLYIVPVYIRARTFY